MQLRAWLARQAANSRGDPPGQLGEGHVSIGVDFHDAMVKFNRRVFHNHR